MESLPAQQPQRPKKISKKNIFFAIGGLVLLGTAYFYWNKNKKTTSTPGTTNSASETNTTDKKKDTTSTSNTTTSTPLVTTLGIVNAKLTTSPLIGQFHLTAVISVVNPPTSGTLQIFIGGEEVDSVALPISENSYVLDKYVVINDPENPQTLLAKIGSITKTVQVQV